MDSVVGYAKSEFGHVAYRADGAGDELLRIPGNLIAIDIVDSHPRAATYLRRLASFSRLIQYDLRGVGRSDPADARCPPTVELFARDALAVLDALQLERAAVLCEGGSFAAIALALAAMAPERVSALVLVNATARLVVDDNYPQGYPSERIDRFLDENTDPEQEWIDPDIGGGETMLIAPSLAADADYSRWWSAAGQRSASPTTAHALLDVTMHADRRGDLEHITARSLVLHTRDNLLTPVSQGRYVADHLVDATFIELPGADHVMWGSASELVLDHIEEFLTGRRGGVVDRVLATVLFTDIVASTAQAAALGDRAWRAQLEQHDVIVRRELARFGGREVNTTGDGFMAAFDSPTQAVRCARSIVDASAAARIGVRTGLHTGECERRGDDLAGLAVHIAARVAAAADTGEVLVSRTVRDLVGGSELRFADRGEHELKGVPERWQLFALEG